MKSYLTGRKQITAIGDYKSEAVDLVLGTPQGSRISPLLFLILMSDLDLYTTDSQLSNFADDTQSVVIADSVQEFREKAQQESENVLSHFSANNLVNNASKAALLYNEKGKAGQINMEIAGANISSVNKNDPKITSQSEKLLGLQVSPSMDWNAHVESTLKKLNHRMYLLRRLREKIPLSKLITVANMIFTSVMRYGICVYLKPRLHGEDANSESKKMQKAQNQMFCILVKKKLVIKSLVKIYPKSLI